MTFRFGLIGPTVAYDMTCGAAPDEQVPVGAVNSQVFERLSLAIAPGGGGVVIPGTTGWPEPTLPAANTGDDDTMDAPAITAPPAIIFLSASRRSIARSPDHPVRTVVRASGHHDALAHAWYRSTRPDHNRARSKFSTTHVAS